MYRCWEHVGKNDKIISFIGGNETYNSRLYSDFMIKGNCFSDPKCEKCGFLPICSGGCPDKRIDNKFNGGRNNLCLIYYDEDRKSLSDLLFQYYLLNGKKVNL